ncbi:hypothetical protein Tco_0115998 [Tanacetum coccineum]
METKTTTDPASPSVSAPKTSLAANARRNNEKALNILLSAIPDRHLLSFHDAVDARSLWKAIKARFGGNEASKKMQKNLGMLVDTNDFGQPGLDELDFDDLYNNLKVYEHELKGVSNSNSQNIAFLSTEVKGSTLKQNEIIVSFFAQQAYYATTHDDEDLLQIDEIYGRNVNIRCRKQSKMVVMKEDSWPIEDSNPKALSTCTLDKEGLGVFLDWSNKADDAPISLALMATNSEYETNGIDFKDKNLKLEDKQKELDQALKERDDFKVKNLKKWSNASVLFKTKT